MRAFPVGAKVNSVKNDDPALANPLEATGGVSSSAQYAPRSGCAPLDRTIALRRPKVAKR
jgi:hypothetical protein